MYRDTLPGHEWWELDDPSERLHGTLPTDFLSPYDPDVVDSPEDMKRFGNDHHPLHNAETNQLLLITITQDHLMIILM